MIVEVILIVQQCCSRKKQRC